MVLGIRQIKLTKAQATGTLRVPVKGPKVVVPIMKSVWQQYTVTAEKFNEPGLFTAVIGVEWTSVPGGNNFHCNVIWHYMAAGYDAVRFGIKISPEVPMKQQERAWTSPIWYTPAQ